MTVGVRIHGGLVTYAHEFSKGLPPSLRAKVLEEALNDPVALREIEFAVRRVVSRHTRKIALDAARDAEAAAKKADDMLARSAAMVAP